MRQKKFAFAYIKINIYAFLRHFLLTDMHREIFFEKNIKKGFTKAKKCGTLLWNAENRIFGIFSVYGDTGVFIARLHQPFAGVSAKIFYFER